MSKEPKTYGRGPARSKSERSRIVNLIIDGNAIRDLQEVLEVKSCDYSKLVESLEDRFGRFDVKMFLSLILHSSNRDSRSGLEKFFSYIDKIGFSIQTCSSHVKYKRTRCTDMVMYALGLIANGKKDTTVVVTDDPFVLQIKDNFEMRTSNELIISFFQGSVLYPLKGNCHEIRDLKDILGWEPIVTLPNLGNY